MKRNDPKLMAWLQAPKHEPIRRTNKLWTTMGETHHTKKDRPKGGPKAVTITLSDLED
jgi:hypothetical protein